MRKTYLTILLLSFILLKNSLFGFSLDNISFPDSLLVQGQELKLNGAAFRKATVFKVKVYGAALYVKEPQKNADSILASKSPKVLMMKFTRSVSQEKINEAWDKAFEAVQDKYKSEVHKLKSLMPSAKDGDTLEYTFSEIQTEIKHNGKSVGTLPGGEWGKTLLSTWLGSNPPTEELKQGLLGIAE